MALQEQGAKARLRVLHFGEDMFATLGAAKHGYDALNMRNVFRKIPRREGDVMEEGQWMCACMSVTRMSLPCSFTLRAFRCVVMSVSRARRASHRGSKRSPPQRRGTPR